jgi:hypothetical protein
MSRNLEKRIVGGMVLYNSGVAAALQLPNQASVGMSVHCFCVELSAGDEFCVERHALRPSEYIHRRGIRLGISPSHSA